MIHTAYNRPVEGVKNYITPAGLQRVRDERVARPARERSSISAPVSRSGRGSPLKTASQVAVTSVQSTRPRPYAPRAALI